MKGTPPLFAALLLALSSENVPAALHAADGSTSTAKPNIVLMVADDLGYKE